MLKVAIYVRVSTDMQAEEGHSIPVQLDKLRAFCKAKDYLIVKEYVDAGYSGSNTDRPALTDLLNNLNDFQAVIVYKLDRLSRSQKDTLHLIEDKFLANNIEFISITENFDTSTPLGRAMIGILATFAQLEREQIKERMAMGNVARASMGYWRGGSGVPIGYKYIKKNGDVPGHLVIDDYEAMQVRKIYELFLQGNTFNSVREKLIEQGFTNSYSSWNNHATIAKILENQIYIGKLKYGGIWYDGVHEPIIDLDTFQKVQIKLVEYRKTLNDHLRNPYKTNHLLTGILWCGECGTKMTYIHKVYPRKNKTYDYSKYVCYTKNGNKKMATGKPCSNLPQKQKELEELIWDEIENLDFENVQQHKVDNSEIDILKKRIAEIDKQVDKLVELYSLGTIPHNIITERSNTLSDERKKLNEQILALTNKKPLMTLEQVKKAVSDIDLIRKSDFDTQRAFILSLIDKIVVYRDKLEIYWKFNG